MKYIYIICRVLSKLQTMYICSITIQPTFEDINPFLKAPTELCHTINASNASTPDATRQHLSQCRIYVYGAWDRRHLVSVSKKYF